MLLKWITCEVSNTSRADFDRTQRDWQCVAREPGFLGQMGGWVTRAQTVEACILVLWENEPCYRRFMAEVHDQIFDKSGQRKAYTKSRITCFDAMMTIPGSLESFPEAIEKGVVLRVADCRVHASQIPHFVDAQEKVWNAGMAAAGGMLCGAFGRAVDVDRRFIAATLWDSTQSHQAYVDNHLPQLQTQAQVEPDLQTIQGSTVELNDGWTVRPG